MTDDPQGSSDKRAHLPRAHLEAHFDSEVHVIPSISLLDAVWREATMSEVAPKQEIKRSRRSGCVGSPYRGRRFGVPVALTLSEVSPEFLANVALRRKPLQVACK